MGDFDSVIHQNSKKREMRLKFEFEKETYFDVKIIKKYGKLLIKDFSCNNGEFEYILKDLITKVGENKRKSGSYTAKKIKFHPDEYDNLINLTEINPVFFKESFFIKIRPAIEDFILESETLVNLIDTSKKDKNAKIQLIDFLNRLYNLERMSNDFYQNIKEEFENIKYIGPIRANAARSYDKNNSSDVGITGKNAVQIMANDPKVKADVESSLKNMGIIKSLEIDNFEEEKNVELKLKTKVTDKAINFADTGCGTAQILPIIVQSLIANRDPLTIIEQPEIHLHPKVQADLADFFIKVATEETKFLLETHSDYFIERVRYGIMTKKIPLDNVAIYYIDQDEAKKSSVINKIELNSEGQYLNLPDSFITNFKLTETRKMTKQLLEILK